MCEKADKVLYTAAKIALEELIRLRDRGLIADSVARQKLTDAISIYETGISLKERARLVNIGHRKNV